MKRTKGKPLFRRDLGPVVLVYVCRILIVYGIILGFHSFMYFNRQFLRWRSCYHPISRVDSAEYDN